MTKPNMKPYDPEHKGEFCTRDGRHVTILKTDARGEYPIIGFVHDEDEDKAETWSETGKFLQGGLDVADLMCVIPKREARVWYIDVWGGVQVYPGPSRVEAREVLPDDISQEKARAVIEAARAVVEIPAGHAWFDKVSADIAALRAALGDDA